MQLLGSGLQPGKKIKHYIYNYSDIIGRGNFSKVYKGINTITQQTIAIKIISLDSLKSKHLEDLVFQQIKILQQINHPNILKFHEALLSERNCYLITELCNNGNLQDRILNKKPLYDQELNKIISDIYQGLKYLRQMGVCHRDIKPANIFINNGQAKIADFGLAKFYKQRFQDLDIGSPLYMSPEGLNQNVYGDKTDTWAFGILIYELIHGETPFCHCQTELALKNAVCHPIPEHKFSRNIPYPLRQLINSLLQINEFRRPSAAELANDPYIKQLISTNPTESKVQNKPNTPNNTTNAHKHRPGLTFANQGVNRPQRPKSHSLGDKVEEKTMDSSVYHKQTPKHTGKEERKLQVYSQSNNVKLIELGGSKPSKNTNNRSLLQPNKNNINQTPTLIQLSNNVEPMEFNQFRSGRKPSFIVPNKPQNQNELLHLNQLKNGRKGSGITVDTSKQSQEDGHFLSGECNRHLHYTRF